MDVILSPAASGGAKNLATPAGRAFPVQENAADSQVRSQILRLPRHVGVAQDDKRRSYFRDRTLAATHHGKYTPAGALVQTHAGLERVAFMGEPVARVIDDAS